MILTDKELKIIRDNIQKLYEVFSYEKVYSIVKDIIEDYRTKKEFSDTYVYMYEVAISGEIGNTSLLRALLKVDGVDFVYYTICIGDDCNPFDELNVSIPLSFLLQENFNWEDCKIKVDGFDEWGDSPVTLDIEMYLPKGREVINNI